MYELGLSRHWAYRGIGPIEASGPSRHRAHRGIGLSGHRPIGASAYRGIGLSGHRPIEASAYRGITIEQAFMIVLQSQIFHGRSRPYFINAYRSFPDCNHLNVISLPIVAPRKSRPGFSLYHYKCKVNHGPILRSLVLFHG